MNPYLVWLFLYSALLVAFGAYISRRVRGASDFLVAGRSLGPGLVFSTFLAANIGAGSTVGAAGLGYQLGWSAWWWVGSAGLGCLILANTVGPRIWRLAHAENFHTLGDYLEWRYNRAVRGSIAATLWVGTLGLLAAQLIAISKILNVVVGLPRWQGCLLGGLVVVCYFAAGGLLSSAWVNFIELIVLLSGFLLAIPFAIRSAGGWHAVTQQVAQRLGTEQSEIFLNPAGIGLSGILYYFALLAPSFIVSPGLIQKLYGARSNAAARIGINCNAVAQLFFAAIPACIGIVAAARFASLQDPELALPKVMMDMLPPWLGILALAAVFSAEISTCDAVLFMLSTSLSVDLYKSFVNPFASERILLFVNRVTAIAGGLLGIGVAIVMPSIISALKVFYGLVSVALFAPVIVGLYTTRAGPRGAMAAIATSVPATLLILAFAGEQVLGFVNPYLLGIGISFLVLWSVTLFDRHESTSAR